MSAQEALGGCIVQVWFDPDTEVGSGKGKFKVIETELPDFATFCEMVDGNRLISGAVLFTNRVEPNVQAIARRQPIAFRGCEVVRCMLPHWRFVEAT